MTDLCLTAELGVIEIGLESEDYERVFEKLEELKKIDEVHKDPEYYLINYFWGQAIFRKEMNRNNVRKKNIDLAIKYFEESLEANSKHVDAHILLGMAMIVKARFGDDTIDVLKTAKEHLHMGVSMGNSSQRMYSKERLHFVNNEIEKLA